MPSPEELQSIATLEAMASGRPILAADARALPELVHAHANGYLFKPNNPQDAAQGLEYLLKARGEWADMGRVSCEIAQEHSLQNSIKQYEENYRLIAERIHIKSRRTTPMRNIQNKYI
jgi:glycosyltransferase involved in cell wall biosynthesis